jgi:hypothetical protein
LDLNALQTYNPSLYQQYLNENQIIQNAINSPESLLENETVVIPVVVHILHNGEAIGSGRNLSVAQIQSQIDVLNEDFRRLNANRINTPAPFATVAADVNIQFRLACTDPNGNPTNGITRTQTSIITFDRLENPDRTTDEVATRIKFTNQGGVDAWNTNSYLNIWVCNLGSTLLGYAQSPFQFANSPNTDGVVILYNAFGRTGNLLSPYDGGQTATHEIGHWLNLFHIWGNSSCGNDQVDDTPVQQGPNYVCPIFPRNTICNNNSEGEMFMNYMDYSPDACMNLFTIGQRNRMRATLFQGARVNSGFMFFGATLPTPTATRFLYGNDFRDLKPFTVQNGGILQVNGVGISRFSNGVILNGSPVTVQPSCNEMVDLNIENNGQLVIGEGQRIGILRTGNGSTVTIKTGATLKISNSSQLVVEAGSKLIIEAGANINLVDLTSRIVIKNGGELIINGQPVISGSGHFYFEAGNIYVQNSDLLILGADRNIPKFVISQGASVKHSTNFELKFENCAVKKEGGAPEPYLQFRNSASICATNVLFQATPNGGGFLNKNFIQTYDVNDAQTNYTDVDFNFRSCTFKDAGTIFRLEDTRNPALGTYTVNRDFGPISVEFWSCNFDNTGNAIDADRSRRIEFAHCNLNGCGIISEVNWFLFVRNTKIRGAYSPIKTRDVGYLWVADGSVIDASDFPLSTSGVQGGIGIDASEGFVWNVLLMNDVTIQRCSVGVKLRGRVNVPVSSTSNINTGLLQMDCANMIDNGVAIDAYDAILSIYGRYGNYTGNNNNQVGSNQFKRDPQFVMYSLDTQRFVKSMFDERIRILGDLDPYLFFTGNYWDGIPESALNTRDNLVLEIKPAP